MCLTVSKENVTVVVPTLNEEEAIEQVILELERTGFRNILVVDGYSTDGTVKVAEANGSAVVLQHSLGKCGAIETAIEHVTTPYMLVMDGDCTYDPKDIGSFLVHAKRFDQIIGVRVNGRQNIPRFNRFGNWLITKTFNVLMGTKLSDVCSGMYLLKTTAARRFELNTRGFDVEVEIAAQTASSGKITEVPIAYRKRVGQQKLNSWKHGFQIIRTLFRLTRRYNPALLFLGVMALAIFPASFILGWVAFEVVLFGIWHDGLALVGVAMLFLALQGLTGATISLLLRRMEKRIIGQLDGN